jgi:hypothetical protein
MITRNEVKMVVCRCGDSLHFLEDGVDVELKTASKIGHMGGATDSN